MEPSCLSKRKGLYRLSQIPVPPFSLRCSNISVLTTPDRLSHLLAAHGLDVRRAEVVRRTVPGDVGVHTVLDHVVEAVRPAA